MSGGVAGQRVLAVIPARGGSKGMQRKNLRELNGRPLFAWSVAAALGANLVDHAVVSTEDDEIAALAETLGVAVQRRPSELATDTAQNDAVALHVLESAEQQLGAFDVVVLLQPTSPLLTAAHIDDCLANFVGGSAVSTMSICPVDHHPGKSVVIESGCIEPFTSDHDMEARRQELPVVYRQNGALYAVRADAFKQSRRFYLRPCMPWTMRREESVDIDSELDLLMAAHLMWARAQTAANS